MLKVLLVCSVYMLTICHSENSFGLPINLNFDMQAVILNALNTSLGLLKEDYHQKINELKRDAMSCTINGSCLNILRKFEELKVAFYQDAEKLKDFEKKTLQINQRQNYIRCIDCIADYIDDIFFEFCEEMDDDFEPAVLTTTDIIPISNTPSVPGLTESTDNITKVTSSNIPSNSTK